MNPIELLIVGILVVLATAYVVRSALAKYRRKSSQPCAGCGCGKSDLIPAKLPVDRILLPSRHNDQ